MYNLRKPVHAVVTASPQLVQYLRHPRLAALGKRVHEYVIVIGWGRYSVVIMVLLIYIFILEYLNFYVTFKNLF